jgi:TRAP-type transport system periplasmic protein
MPETAHSIVRMAGYQGSGSILTAALNQFAQTVQATTSLQVQVEIDTPSQGESAASLFASVDQGSRHICYMASGYLSARVPQLDVLDLPFAISDRSAALAALDGAAGRMLAAAVTGQTGYQLLGFWDNGFRHISNQVRPIYAAKDCQGIVIRTLDSASYRAALAALGFTPRTTDVKDLVRMVQSGEVQAQENPLTNLLNFGLWRYHPYVSMTSHYFGVLLLVCHGAWFQALPPEQQAQIQTAATLATQAQRQRAAAEDTLALAQLRSHGVQVIMPEALDKASFRQAIAAIDHQQRQAIAPELLRAYLRSQS